MDKLNLSNDPATLDAFCRDLGKCPEMTGLTSPPKKPSAAVTPPAIPAQTEAAPTIPATPSEPLDIFKASKIAFTGRMKAGKDFLAGAIGAEIVGLADPLYFLLEEFHGVTNKDAFGAREFLQRVGQWGRGLVNAEHPLTTERGLFSAWIKSLCLAGQQCVDWDTFGRNESIWLDSAIERAKLVLRDNPRVVISNVRFENELVRLRSEGWTIFHVMCSQPTWKERLEADKVKPEATKNVSESLASSIDQDVFRKLSKGRVGPKLRCVWCDDKVKCPSPRIFTVEEFVKGFSS